VGGDERPVKGLAVLGLDLDGKVRIGVGLRVSVEVSDDG
jgi:hypothetical protein